MASNGSIRTLGVAAPRTLSDSTPEYDPATSLSTDDVEGTSSFVRGLKSAVYSSDAGSKASQYYKAKAAGRADEAAQAEAEARDFQQQATSSAPKVQSLRDIHGPGDLSNWVAGQAGAAIPSVVPPLIAGALGSVVGGGLAGHIAESAIVPAAEAGSALGAGSSVYDSTANSALLNAMDSPGANANMTPQQILDNTRNQALVETPAMLAGPGYALKNIMGGASKSVLGNVVKHTAVNAGAGAGTEAIAHNFESQRDPNRDTSQDNQDTADSAASFGLLGVPFGAAESTAARVHQGAAGTIGAVRTLGAVAGDTAKNLNTERLGAAIGKSASGAKGWLEARLNKSDNPDGATLDEPQKAPPGTNTNQGVFDYLRANDVQRNEAATRLATQYMSDENTPPRLKEAAQNYLNGPKTADAWAPFVTQVQGNKAGKLFSDGVKTVMQAFGKKADVDSRQNLQTTTNEDPFNELLTNKLAEHALDAAGFADSQSKLSDATPALKDWIENGFARKPGGAVFAPPGLDQVFKDPVKAVTDAHDLMQRQGLTPKDSAERLKEVTAAINAQKKTRGDVSGIVKNYLLPTAEAQYNIKPSEHDRIGSEVQQMIKSGKFNEPVLDALFGPNKAAAVSEIGEKTQLEKGEHQKAGGTTELSDETAHGDTEQNPNEVRQEIQYHGKFKADGTEGSEARAKDMEGKLTGEGYKVSRMGVVDALREHHAANPDGYVNSVLGLIAKHSKDPDIQKAVYENKQKIEDALNEQHFVLRAETGRERREGIDLSEKDVKDLALKTGKDGKYGTVKDGAIWFERNTLDKGTGELGTSLVATNAHRLISRMRAAAKEGTFTTSEGRGVVENHDMLMAGIASVLSAKDADGKAVTSGRIGFKKDEHSPVTWLKAGESLPKELKMYGGTVGDVAKARDAQHLERVTSELKEKAAKMGEASWSKKDQKELDAVDGAPGKKDGATKLKAAKEHAERVAEAKAALESKDVGRIEAVLKNIDESRTDSEKKTATVQEVDKKGAITTKHLSETEEMAAQKKLDSTPRKYDETTGAEIQPRATRAELADTADKLEAAKATEKQVGFLLDALRKGIPAFGEMMRKAKDDQLGPMREALKKMLAAKSRDNPIWHGKPPKDIEAFGQRARVALERMNEYMKDKTEPDVEHEKALDRHAENEVKPETTEEKSFASHQSVFASEPMSKETAKAVIDEAHRTLGPQIKVEIAKLFGANKKEISGEWVQGTLRVSPYAKDPLGVGAHEGMHEFFNRLMSSQDATVGRVKQILLNASNSDGVYRQLKVLLDGETAALKQIHKDSPNFAEERLAYAYQFWRAGLLEVGPETKTTFQKISDFLRSVIGLLTNDQKAEKIFRAFRDGKMTTEDATSRVLANNIEYREKLLKNAAAYAQKAVQPLVKLTESTEGRLMRTDNPHIQDIFRDFKNPRNEGNKAAYNEASNRETARRTNKFTDLIKDYTPKEVELVDKYLTNGKPPADAQLRKLYNGVHGILDEMAAYMHDAGVKRMNDKGEWENFGHIKDYFPRAYELHEISKDVGGFVDEVYATHTKEVDAVVKSINDGRRAAYDELSDYEREKLGPNYAAELEAGKHDIDAEKFLQNVATRIVQAHGQAELSETDTAVGFSPNMRAVNRRSLTWLKPERLNSKWFDHDMVNTITSYIAQGAKRAEYTRRFGVGGEGLTARMNLAYEHEVEKLKAADPTSKTIEEDAIKKLIPSAKAIMGLEGTLGHDISPTWRMAQGSLMAYENMRTMGTSVFSTLIDPLGLIVNGGEMSDAWKAYKRGLSEIVSVWKGEHTNDKDARVAELIGTTDAAGALANFGQMYSGLALDKNTRKMNEGLFKWNGMEAINRAFRIQGTQAAIGFLKKHSTLPSEHSERYLRELGLQASDIKVSKDGDINWQDQKVGDAVYRWVNGAILRPTAAHRPVWMNDPHYMLFGHMKQFGYTFNDTIMKKAWHELKEHANMGPMASTIGLFVPVMLAADAAKSVLLSGSVPEWMHGSMGSVIAHGADRAGLFGPAQPFIDLTLPHRSVFSLGGPAVDQGASWFTQPLGESLTQALPGASVINTIAGRSTQMADQGED